MDMAMDAWTDPGRIIGIHQLGEKRDSIPIASAMHENAMLGQQVHKSGSTVDGLGSLCVKQATLEPTPRTSSNLLEPVGWTLAHKEPRSILNLVDL
jgi:hypothetical protein